MVAGVTPNREELIKTAQEFVQWWGTRIAEVAPATAILEAYRDVHFTPDEFAKAVEFYEGRQWPQDVLEFRAQRPPRPTLVVNRLPDLVAVALAKSDGDLNPQSRTRLIVILTRQNQDAQMAYNYVVSAFVEMVETMQPSASPSPAGTVVQP